MVITTIDSADAAEQLARGVVDARVGACAQVVGPIRSAFRWDGAVQVEAEWQIWVKTTTARMHRLIEHIEHHHSYDVPEIVATPIIGGNAEYLRWVSEETKGD
jgi:periplasmic divalent cation tolerance protein